jgi:hypothetical protein
MNKNVTLESFTKYMKAIAVYDKEYEINAQALNMLYPESYAVPSLGALLLDSYIELLEKVLEDDSHWISYFVFDCKMGAEEQEITINKIPYKLNSVTSLYDLIQMEDV